MKLLLDENVPIQIKQDILDFKTVYSVFTVAEKGWKGTKNGELLKFMLEEKFDALITADKNIQHQQNFEKYPLPVIVLHTSRLTYGYLNGLMPQLEKRLLTDLSGGVISIKPI